MPIQVTHFPPGTSKWNKIEHRLFSYISINWRGKPLDEMLTVINLIASTTTAAGLTVECISDTQEYKKGRVVTDEELAAVRLEPQDFHGEWNYVSFPIVKFNFAQLLSRQGTAVYGTGHTVVWELGGGGNLPQVPKTN